MLQKEEDVHDGKILN